METVKAVGGSFETVKDLKSLLAAQGPCLTMYMSLGSGSARPADNGNTLQWRELLSGVETQVAASGRPEERELLGSVSDLSVLLSDAPGSGKSVAVFRSPDVLRVAYLQHTVPPQATLGKQFAIRPLLLEVTRGTSFHLLALSQNDVRLLHCTLTTSEEVPLGKSAATSFDAYMNPAKPDHDRVNGASAGAGDGGSKLVVGTTSSERETKPEYLAHFFKQIDKAVCEKLKGSSDPLILAGVDYERSQYKTINSYPHLLSEGVQGAPNGLKAGEMHARAIQALEKAYEQKIDDVLGEYNHKVGGGASNRLKDVVTAAHDGRVLTLIISDSLTNRGSFDEATNQASGSADGESDLVNDAAIQTLTHAGNVLVANNAKMPHGAPAAAIFRY